MLDRIGWVIFISFAAHFVWCRGPEQRICQNRSISGTSEKCAVSAASHI